MGDDIIAVEGLTKVFNKHLLDVDHMSFGVKQGEVYGFLGPNGASNTTTIHMLTTVLKPNEGSATICSYDIGDTSFII